MAKSRITWSVVRRVDLGDLPDTGAGVGPGNYQTLVADGGPMHDIVPGLFMGAGVDNEADGQPGVNADGDDLLGDDEDGVVVADFTDVQLGLHRRCASTRPTSVQARHVSADSLISMAMATLPMPRDRDATRPCRQQQPAGLVETGPSSPAPPATSYARFRLSTATTLCSASGAEPDGEVEDYVVSFRRYDFGDLPDTGAGVGTGDYQTQFADNGAAHGIVSGLRIGACVDAETMAEQGAGADGDDNGIGSFTSGTCAVAGDDEDGVQLRTIYNQGGPTTTPSPSPTPPPAAPPCADS